MILFCSVPSVFKRIKDKQIERNDTYSKNVLFYPKVSGPRVQTFCNEKPRKIKYFLPPPLPKKGAGIRLVAIWLH